MYEIYEMSYSKTTGVLSSFQKVSKPLCQATTSMFLFAFFKIPAMNSIYLSLFFYFVLAN